MFLLLASFTTGLHSNNQSYGAASFQYPTEMERSCLASPGERGGGGGAGGGGGGGEDMEGERRHWGKELDIYMSTCHRAGCLLLHGDTQPQVDVNSHI